MMKRLSVNDLKKDLRSLADRDRVTLLSRFFKTGKGEYGEGDKFLGLTVPQVRKICSRYLNISLAEIEKILSSSVHEDRLSGTIILVDQYQRASDVDKKAFFNFYIDHAERFNNWDLVDISAPKIVGDYLIDRDREIIYKFAVSNSLWKKRIALLSTFAFIKNGETEDVFSISKLLFGDANDLIHKPMGWMLREVGKNVSEEDLKIFLKKYRSEMPRTALRYAIERLSEKDRNFFLSKK